MLKHITLTGADDSVSPERLFELSEMYPFVEWGILLSKKQSGTPRFPSIDWLDDFAMEYYMLSTKKQKAINLSLHLCGQYVRDFLSKGDDQFAKSIGFDLWSIFNRVQINTHAEPHVWDLNAVSKTMQRENGKKFIFQLDGCGDNEARAKMLALSTLSNVEFLLDGSHGAGLLPSYWPLPPLANTSTGYAGGIGPHNIADSHKLIVKAVETRTDFEKDYWIDMETQIRSGDHLNPLEKFDLEKCEKVLQAAVKWFK